MRRRPVEARVLNELRTGFHYVMGSDPIRTALLLLAIVSALGMPYTVLMPVIVSTVLHGGPSTLGLLMTASGLGALAGALYLASRESVVGLGRVSTISTIAFGAGLIALRLDPQRSRRASRPAASSAPGSWCRWHRSTPSCRPSSKITCAGG